MPWAFRGHADEGWPLLPSAWRPNNPVNLTPHQRQEALARLEAGETQADVARTYNVDTTTIGRRPSPFDGVSAAE